MSSKRELVLKAFHNEETERIPVGFWHHFLTGEDFNGGLENETLYIENWLKGLKIYILTVFRRQPFPLTKTLSNRAESVPGIPH